MLPVTRTSAVAGVLSALLGLGGGPVAAQPPAPGLGLTTPAPERPAVELGLEPTLPPEQRGSRDQDFYSGRIRTRHEPAFVTPFVATGRVSRTSAVRVGLSAWTAPPVPFDTPEAGGGLAFGLSVLWGVPVGEEKAPEAPAPAPAER